MKVKNKAILIVSIMILTLACFNLYQGISRYNLYIEEETNAIRRDFEETFFITKENLFKPYLARIQGLVETSPWIAEALVARDEKSLQIKTLPRFQTLKRENPHFNYLHYYLADGTLFLEMQNSALPQAAPLEKDIIKNLSRQSQLPQSGFQVEKNCELFRIIQPIYRSGKFVGALEFGLDISQILIAMGKQLNAEVACYFNRKFVPESFIEEYTTLDRGDYVITNKTGNFHNNLPPELSQIQEDKEIFFNKRHQILHTHPMFTNLSGQVIGGIMALQDITSISRQKTLFIKKSVLVTVILLTISFVVLYLSFNRIIGKLEKSRQQKDDLVSQLTDEIKNRIQVEELLLKNHSLLEQRVIERTTSLEEANLALEQTIRKRRLAEEELNKIFNTAADGMRVIDRDFIVTRVNETMLSLTGYTLKEFVGNKCYEVFPGISCHTPNCPMHQIMAGKAHIESEINKTRKNGQVIPCILTAKPLYNEEGLCIGIVENFKDISLPGSNRKRLSSGSLKSTPPWPDWESPS